MRKKSHLSLAKYLMNCNGMESLKAHKASFYIGSIWPDCNPSFLYRKHSIDASFCYLEKELKKINKNFDPEKGANRYFCRHLGIMTHYISDYFTFPHNSHYMGSLREHCSYEEELKHALRSYVKSDEAKRAREKNGIMHSTEDVLSLVKRVHAEYMKQLSAVKRDCEFIVGLCHQVVDAILQLFHISGTQVVVAA